MKRPICWISLVTSISLGTVACGSATDTTTTTTTSTTSAAADNTFVAPIGWAVYGDQQSGFRMAFPPSWVDVSRMLNEDPEAFNEAFEGTSMEGAGPETLALLNENALLILFNTEGVSDGFAENVNMLVFPQGRSETLDTVGSVIPTQLESMGASDLAIADYLTARYPGITIDYRTAEFGDVIGRQYYLLTDGSFWVITFTGQATSDTAVWNQAVDSLAAYGPSD